MKFNDWLRFFKSYGPIILGAALIFGLVGIFYAQRFPVSYEANQTVFVKRQTSPTSKQFYTYDGYYSAQAAERFADSLVGSLKSREVLRFLLGGERRVGSVSAAADKIAAAIRVKRLSPQLISFSYRSDRADEAVRIIEEISLGLSQLSLNLSQGGDEGVSLHFINDRPQLVPRPQSLLLDGLIGLLLGAFLSLVGFLFWDYSRHLLNG